MTEPFGHQALRSRHCFEGLLQLETPLRLSSGRASDLTDAPLMRDRDHKIFIPGSSLRGALRSEVERVLAGVGESAGLRACVLFAPDEGQAACVTASREKQEALQELEEKAGRREATPAERNAPLDYLEKHLCHVCQLFGSPVYASRLMIEDAYPVAGTALQTAVRDGVGIDRDTGAARGNVKFDYEVLEGKPHVTLRLRIENLTETDRKLLNLIFALLRQGLHIGGKRAAGLGQIKLSGPLKVHGFKNGDELWKAMLGGTDPHVELEWKEEIAC